MKELKVTGYIDVEADGPVLTVVGTGGTVAISTIDGSGAKLYVYHPNTGWMEQMDMTHDPDPPPRMAH